MMPNRPKFLLPILVSIAVTLGTLISIRTPVKARLASINPKIKSAQNATSNPEVSVGHATIPGNPLTIHVAQDASYQVEYEGERQVYPPLAKEADSGIFVWYSGEDRDYVIGPDFNNHNLSAANLYDPWTSVSQSEVGGTGTQGAPWMVQTSMQYMTGTLTINLTTTTRYVNGEDSFTIEWDICLPDVAEISTFLAADLSTDGDQLGLGYGYYNSGSGSVGGYNPTQDWLQAFTPVTPASHYYEDEALNVWNAIGQAGLKGTGFNDTINTDLVSNGAGLQWDLSVNGCANVVATWGFDNFASPTDTPIPTASPTPSPTATPFPPPENPIYLPTISK